MVSRRMFYIMWMVAHVGIAVDMWALRLGHDPTTPTCVS